MKRQIFTLTVFGGLIGLAAALPTNAFAQAATRGKAVFVEHCATCHVIDPKDRPKGGDHPPPLRPDLEKMTPERIVTALATGPMVPMATGLSDNDKKWVAEFLAGVAIGASTEKMTNMAGKCDANTAAFPDPAGSPIWNGYSPDSDNSRSQTKEAGGITLDNIGRLKLAFAFGFPGSEGVYGTPAVVSERIFVGNNNGYFYSIDAKTGCWYWTYFAQGAVRAAPTVAKSKVAKSGYAVFFGDQRGFVHAVDALTGAPIWKIVLGEDQPGTRITGAPVMVGDRLIVPVAAAEELSAGIPTYECCHTRGRMAALDPNTGKRLWHTYVGPEPKVTGATKNGVKTWGPAGANIWATPTYDAQTGLIYAGTGNSFSHPVGNSNSIIAFDVKTGKIAWIKQLFKNDVFNTACFTGPQTDNCPPNAGPDVDIASAPILRKLPNGKRLLIVAGKSGQVWGLDPDNKGEIQWEGQNGEVILGGGGGIKWGIAADTTQAYTGADAKGGIKAFRIADGKEVWSTPAPMTLCERGPCSRSQGTPPLAVPGLVFAGVGGGVMRAYSSVNGQILWEYDTNRTFKTVNDVPAKGGGFSSNGPIAVDGRLIMGTSNGNALLVFDLAPETSAPAPGAAFAAPARTAP